MNLQDFWTALLLRGAEAQHSSPNGATIHSPVYSPEFFPDVAARRNMVRRRIRTHFPLKVISTEPSAHHAIY